MVIEKGDKFYLAVKIVSATDDPLFDTADITADSALVDVESASIVTNVIYFAAIPAIANTSAIASGSNSLTSTVFSGSGTSISYNSTNGPLEINKTYYIQFGPDKLDTTGFTTGTAVRYRAVTGGTLSTYVAFDVAKVNDNLLSITPISLDDTWTADITGVAIAMAKPNGTPSEYSTGIGIPVPNPTSTTEFDTRTINVTGGKLTISDLTIKK